MNPAFLYYLPFIYAPLGLLVLILFLKKKYFLGLVIALVHEVLVATFFIFGETYKLGFSDIFARASFFIWGIVAILLLFKWLRLDKIFD